MNTKEAIKNLLMLYKNICVKEDQLEKLGLEIDFRWDESVSDIALDLIGFPKDNSANFDFSHLNNPEFVKPNPEKRNDFDKMFCRDWLDDEINSFAFEEEGHLKIDELVEWLYKEKQNLNP